jgi:hypothetical protein
LPRTLTVSVGVALLCIVGCSKRPLLPETYPVQGRVVFQGGQPVRGGSVWFRPQNDPNVTTRGEIKHDGTFTLHSSRAGGHSPGAIAGPHRVTVVVALEGRSRVVRRPHLPPASAGSSGTPSLPTIAVPETRTVTLSDVYTVKPGDNDFTLVVPRGERERRHSGRSDAF